jgi:molybdopterin/thiamine biosynthesis adenylyltransferase
MFLLSHSHSCTPLDSLNSDVRVEAVQLAFIPAIFHPPTGQTPSELLEGRYTLILDCSDNPATRHFLNAYAAAHQIPLVSGGAVRAEGTVGVFNLPLTGSASDDDNRGPCYACIFPPSGPPPSPPPPLSVSQFEALTDQERKERERLEDLYYERLSLSGTGACADEGVVGILCGVVGIGMASEAMRVLLGIGARARVIRNREQHMPAEKADSAKTHARSYSDPALVLASFLFALPNHQDARSQTDLSSLRHAVPLVPFVDGNLALARLPRPSGCHMARLVRPSVRDARSGSACLFLLGASGFENPSAGLARTTRFFSREEVCTHRRYETGIRVRHRQPRRQYQ